MNGLNPEKIFKIDRIPNILVKNTKMKCAKNLEFLSKLSLYNVINVVLGIVKCILNPITIFSF